MAKTIAFFKSIDDFQGMKEVYERKLEPNKPVRTMIAPFQVSFDGLVEAECIASAHKD